MHTERIQRLIDLLRGAGPYAAAGPVPDDNFDMDKWIRPIEFTFETDDLGVSIEDILRNRPSGCGFAACALGWAASDPWFFSQGLTFQLGSRDTDWWGEVFFRDRNNALLRGASAAHAFFEIPISDVFAIFIEPSDWTHYGIPATPEVVADMLEALLRGVDCREIGTAFLRGLASESLPGGESAWCEVCGCEADDGETVRACADCTGGTSTPTGDTPEIRGAETLYEFVREVMSLSERTDPDDYEACAKALRAIYNRACEIPQKTTEA